MSKHELDTSVRQLIAALLQAQPGAGASAERAAARRRAFALMFAMPKDWWLQADKTLVAHCQQLL